ncbi:uncharacterized protein LOC112091217 [Morus notabilis]|uniref:uncharacterized protein LOC112091217 n=1 Tax=Morus notabilis TaxID=981085 RepID=UPI000CED12A2|nr:uncharacterized protein LOC112091217 [Morus notabilis]XP_024020029.1 uncharacterized protein LOC112091217 [Morus notabilis]
MAVYKSRLGLRHSPAVMMAAMMLVAGGILINANCGGAVVLVRSNVTYGCISGREEACLIAEDLELEWLMEYSSHVARVLGAAGQDHPGKGAEKGSNVPCKNGNGNSYGSGKECPPTPKPKPNGKCKNKYERGCHS